MIVHLISDRRRLAPTQTDWRACLLAQARHAVDAGVDVFQIREDLEARELFLAVVQIVSVCRGSRTRVVVNDRLDVALAGGADGVHLPARGMAPHLVRRLVPSAFLVGRSVHTVEAAGETEGADYLIAGTVWASASKPSGHRELGIAGLSAIVAASAVPVLAIGGVTTARAPELLQAGAAGVAAIGLFLDEVVDRPCRAVSLMATVAALRDGSR